MSLTDRTNTTFRVSPPHGKMFYVDDLSLINRTLSKQELLLSTIDVIIAATVVGRLDKSIVNEIGELLYID